MAMNNSLAEVRPELVSEWSEKNLPLTPDNITFGSNKKVWWKGTCGHEWQTSVKARSNGEKCPICSGARVIAGINDLTTLEPLLVKQWSKKNKIKPTEVSIGSHKRVIWRCEKGHEWEAAIKSRTINKTGCPYCSHNKVLAGFNDLETYIPSEKLAIESGSADENIEIMKAYMCKQRGIRLIKLPMKGTELDYANNLKKAFQSVHIFISSDTEEDVEIIKNTFERWRESQ